MRPLAQPSTDERRLVGCILVEDEMYVELRRDRVHRGADETMGPIDDRVRKLRSLTFRGLSLCIYPFTNSFEAEHR